MGLERILVSGGQEETPERIEKMKAYATDLWAFAQKHDVSLSFVTVQPDHSRVMLTVKDEDTQEKLFKAFASSDIYELKKDQISGLTRVHSREPKHARYEIGVAIKQRAYIA